MSHRSISRLTLTAAGAALAVTVTSCGTGSTTTAGGSSPEGSPSTSSAESQQASSAATTADPAADSRLTAIKEAGTLRICSTGDYKPFTELTEAGEWRGIDVDMAKDLAETMGVEPEFVQTSWKTLMDDYLAGCDVAVGGISMNPERAEQVYFSVPTQEDGKTPIARCEDVEKYDTIEEINQPGVRSIMPEGGTNQKFAQEHYPEGTLLTHDNRTIFDALAAGEADVMTTDRSEVLYIDHEYEELCATNPDEPFDYFQKGYMLPQGDEVFKHYVDQWLAIALKDGTYDEISEPWVGDVELGLPEG